MYSYSKWLWVQSKDDMKLGSLETVVEALNIADIRYIIVGGLAVNAHGYGRVTYDVDLVIRLDRDEVLRTFKTFAEHGFRPIVPVTAEQFADRETREMFIREKGMVVLQFFSDAHPETRVDVFVKEPFDFDAEYKEAYVGEVRLGLPARFVRLSTLIKMKRLAGRDKDRDDVNHLELLRRDA